MSDVVPAAVIEVKYSKDSDVLYLTRGRAAPARSREGEPGLVWRYDAGTGDLVGLTVVDFSRYWRPRRSWLIEQIADKFKISTAEARAIVGRIAA